MKNKTKIAIAAGVGLAGFLIYSNWDKILSALKGKDDETGTGASESASTEPGKNGEPSEYDSLVRKLQAFLGVGVDGKPGQQTNWKLDGYFYDGVNVQTYDTAQQAAAAGYGNLKRNGKGVVSPDNVKWYIDTLEARKAPSQIRWKAASTSKVGKAMWDAALKGAKLLPIINFETPLYGYDPVKKGYTANYSWPKATFRKDVDLSLPENFTFVSEMLNGSLVLRMKAYPDRYLLFNPNNFRTQA